ncbi:MAG: hypothetical protein ACRD16_15055, partial [Thermoanaerobaculia bacterium]
MELLLEPGDMVSGLGFGRGPDREAEEPRGLLTDLALAGARGNKARVAGGDRVSILHLTPPRPSAT